MVWRQWHGKQFVRTFLSYLLLLFVGMLIFSGLFINGVLKENREQASKRRKETAEGVAALIDSGLQNMIYLSGKMSGLHWVLKLRADAPSASMEFDPLTRMNVVNDLRSYLGGDAFYTSAMLIFPQQETVISKAGWFELEDYLQYIKEEPFASQLPSVLHQRHDYDILFSQEDGRNLWVVKTMDNAADPQVQLFFQIDRIQLQRHLQKYFPDPLCKLEIRDRQGTLLAALDNTSRYGDGDQLEEMVIDAASLEWRYAITFNTSTLTISTDSFLSLAFAVAVCCLIQPLLAYLLARVSYRPLQKLLLKLQENEGGERSAVLSRAVPEYQAIEEHIDSLSLDNRHLRQRMSEYQESVQNDLLRQLLQGYFDRESLSDRLEAFQLGFTEETAFGVMIVSFFQTGEKRDGESQEGFFRQRVASILYVEQSLQEAGWPYYLLTSYEEGIVAIVYGDQQTLLLEDAVLEAVAKGMEQGWEESAPLTLQVFTGRVETGLIGISKSYQMAKEKLSYSAFSHKLYQPQEFSTGHVFYYPTDWEIQLINNLKTAQLDSTQRILNEIREENQRRELPPEACRALLHALRNTIQRVAAELNVSDFKSNVERHLIQHRQQPVPEDSTTKRMIEEQWNWLEAGCRVICGRSRYSRAEPTDVSTQLVEFVNTHFGEPSISLKELAARFNVSTSTVSAAFKPLVGLNFYDYVSRLRMEKAKELLRKSELSIREICRQVGYENEYSFRRAYLRYEGITPSEYRNKEKQESSAEGPC